MRHIERQPQKQIKLGVCACVRAIGMRSVAGRRSARNADPNNQKSRSRLITHTHTTPITRFYILLLYTRIYTVIVCVNQQQQKEIVKINHRNQPNTKRICVNSMRLSPPKHFPIALHGDQTIDWVLSRQSVCCSARISNHTHTPTQRCPRHSESQRDAWPSAACWWCCWRRWPRWRCHGAPRSSNHSKRNRSRTSSTRWTRWATTTWTLGR